MDFSPETIRNFLLMFPILLLSVALHEFAHCWTNDRLGDDTPRLAGRVTLNPFAHLSLLGTVMMFVSSFSGFGIGWGNPSPVNTRNFKNPARDRMIGALAGPVSNILQMLAWASLGGILSTLYPITYGFIHLKLCIYGVMINAGLAVFNLLPIYPLDGHHVLSYFAPRSWRPIIDNPAWSMVFLALVLIRPLWDGIVMPVLQPAIHGLYFLTSFIVGWPG